MDGTVTEVMHVCEQCAAVIDENRQVQADMASWPVPLEGHGMSEQQTITTACAR